MPGFFDIDFILADSGTPFVIETNMRRTVGIHAYDVARRMFGKNGRKIVLSCLRITSVTERRG
jgi:predicted ATP-grasp superfamily ATP-dependent carboligase